MVVCRNNEGAWLLYRRSRQPFRNLIGFPYGKIHLGETIVAAAARELVEKTGIEASLSHAGDAYLTVSQDDDVVSQMLAHIFVGEKPRGTLKETSEIGTCFWADLATFASADLMPGVHDIITLLSQSRDHFFRELSYRL
ncbi:NUDIX hydrolase [Candidatus Berkelbacteria bacterium]|nr:NUDIX hydrolase [Candidatus Berkelbacteria bacterium]